MRRIFQDINGRVKCFEYVGPGPVVKWHPDHKAGPSTIWRDVDTEENIRVPDNAWEVFKMVFTDKDEEN